MEDFRGLENRVQTEQMKFSSIQNSYAEFKSKEQRVDHYNSKILRLEDEQTQLEMRGKILGKRKINRIIRVRIRGIKS